jgi:hypothetical protein
LYTHEQRLNAARGELGALKLPHVLALFAGKMGARYLGPPYFDTRFNVFAAPLATDLAELGDKPAAARALSGLLIEPPASDATYTLSSIATTGCPELAMTSKRSSDSDGRLSTIGHRAPLWRQ